MKSIVVSICVLWGTFTMASDLTVWKLKEMAEQAKSTGDESALEDIFYNQSLSLPRLPVGYSAGTGILRAQEHFEQMGDNLVERLQGIALYRSTTEIQDLLIGKKWKGKIFYNSFNGLESVGKNRIQQTILFQSEIYPQGSFETKLIDSHKLVPGQTQNMVILSYPRPCGRDRCRGVEEIVKNIGILDIMVAVPGKYGPLYVGKTFEGHYRPDGSFTGGRFIAWYFLDFNKEALEYQKKHHWEDGLTEYKINPNNSTDFY